MRCDFDWNRYSRRTASRVGVRPSRGSVGRFEVSAPAVREALRILEIEGLISVRRGNVGAIITCQPARGVDYMMSLLLQVQQASFDDVGAAIRDLEPLCAALCSRRPGRSEQVVPVLRRLMDDQIHVPGDAIAYNRMARCFHETLAEQCGNKPMGGSRPPV